MIIEASSCDMDIIRANAGSTGKVHSLYKSAITLDFKGTMITILPEERGEGPGFVLISTESEFPPRTLLKPGEQVSIDDECSRINAGNLEIVMEKAEGFSSLLFSSSDIQKTASAGTLSSLYVGSRVAPAPGGNKSRTDVQGAGAPCHPKYEEKKKDEDGETEAGADREQLIRFIGEYFLNADNLGNSLLSRVAPELKSVDLQCSIGSCVLSVWKDAVDDILTDLRQSIERWDEKMFGETLKRLVGMGWGLTPGGDDFILGMLGFTSLILAKREKMPGMGVETGEPERMEGDDSFAFVNRQIRNHLPGFLNKTGFIPASYLKYALEGRYVASFTDFLKSLKKGNIKELETSLAKLTEYGATSGMDMAAGVMFLM